MMKGLNMQHSNYLERGEQRRKEQGFTLIETMIAMLIGGIVLLALGGMLTTSIRTNQQSEHRMEAVAKAQSIMAYVSAKITPNYTQTTARSQARQQLCAPGNIGLVGACTAGRRESIYTSVVTLTPTTVPLTGSVGVHVQLAWTEHGMNKTVSLSSQVVL